MRSVLGLMVVTVAAFGLVLGCDHLGLEDEINGNGTADAEPLEGEGELELRYVHWDCAIAKTYTAQVLLEEIGYDVEVTAGDAEQMWSDVAEQEADAFVAGWLRYTHGSFYDDFADDVDDLGAVFEGTRIGLMVPTYVTIDSIEELNDHTDEFDGKIIGIESGAGIMSATEQALDEYGLEDFTLDEGSDQAMQTALAEAYDDQEWIVVTGWTPHPMEAQYDLKYLEDPEGLYGPKENIHAVARENLDHDMPAAHQFLTNMYWEISELAELMSWNAHAKHGDAYENATEWVEQNRDVVDAWVH